MTKEEIIATITKSKDGKVFVADILAADSDPKKESAIGLIDSLTRENTVRVFRDKDNKRLMAKLTGKSSYDFSWMPAATAAQIATFEKAEFDYPNVMVVCRETGRSYQFRVVKLAGKRFADVYTPDGHQAGFLKYMTNSVHPWWDDIGETHKVLQFTTIQEGKNVIEQDSGISYWINHDFYGQVFGKMHKDEQFRMVSMNGLVRFIINKLYPEVKDDKGNVVRKPSMRIRVNSIGIKTWNDKDLTGDVTIGDKKLTFKKSAPTTDDKFPTAYLLDGEEVIAEGYFRLCRNSNNFYESNVTVKKIPEGVKKEDIIAAIVKVMEENSAVSLGNGFEKL